MDREWQDGYKYFVTYDEKTIEYEYYKTKKSKRLSRWCYVNYSKLYNCFKCNKIGPARIICERNLGYFFFTLKDFQDPFKVLFYKNIFEKYCFSCYNKIRLPAKKINEIEQNFFLIRKIEKEIRNVKSKIRS